MLSNYPGFEGLRFRGLGFFGGFLRDPEDVSQDPPTAPYVGGYEEIMGAGATLGLLYLKGPSTRPILQILSAQ